MRCFLPLALMACSSSAPPAQTPVTPTPVDAAPAPSLEETAAAARERATQSAVATTPYVFQFASTARTETWTLWFATGVAVLNVQPANGALVQYQGSMTEGDPMVVEVQGPTAKMKLECKRTVREVGPRCDASAATSKKKPATSKVEALDCFVAGFKEPMPFGVTPGITYVADGACAGYRAL